MTDVNASPADLYGLPLDRFVPERTALAKALRGAGRPDEAKRVAALRKPSVAAWAVNQLVRTQQRELAALLRAGDELRRAQEGLVAGRGDAAALRDAAAAERAAVNALVQRASGLLDAGGHELSRATLERVSDTLHAAALEDEAREAVTGGCLDRELRHVGLGALTAAPAAPAAPAGRAAPAAKRERAERLKTARSAEVETGKALERARRDLEAARRRREEAARELDQAEQAVTAAERAEADAQRAHADAQRALQDAER
jgi:hypothetical protein